MLIFASASLQAQDTTLLKINSSKFRNWKHVVLPSVEWNHHDGFMLGGVVTNASSVTKGFKYHVRPMYAFGSKKLTGTANLGYDIYNRDKDARFERIWMNVDMRHYSLNDYEIAEERKLFDRYFKIAPELALFTLKNLNFNVTRSRISTRFIGVHRNYITNFDPENVENKSDFLWLQELRYELSKSDDLDKLTLVAVAHANDNFFKAFYRVKKSYAYNSKKHAITIRHNAGFNTNPITDNSDFNTRLQANGRNGLGTLQNDYTYDQNLLGRSQFRGIWSQQVYDKGAGLRSVGILPTDGDWVVGIGIEADIPIPMDQIKISAYFDSAIYPKLQEDGTQAVYSSGLTLHLVPGTFSIHFPLFESAVIRERYESNGRPKFVNRITWSFRIKRVNHVVEDYYN